MMQKTTHSRLTTRTLYTLASILFLSLHLLEAAAQAQSTNQPQHGETSRNPSNLKSSQSRSSLRNGRPGIRSDATRILFRATSEAMKYAPIVYHQNDEVNWPVNVEWLTARTSLWLYVKGRCNVMIMKGSQVNVPGQTPLNLTPLEFYMTTWGERWVNISTCGSGDGTSIDFFNGADRDKNRTYYLRTFGTAGRGGIGPENMSQWTTYVHEYENQDGGATIQYWRVYSYQDFLPDLGGKHGGDWESVQVVLDASRVPEKFYFLVMGGLILPTRKSNRFVVRGPGIPTAAGIICNGVMGTLSFHPSAAAMRAKSLQIPDTCKIIKSRKLGSPQAGGLRIWVVLLTRRQGGSDTPVYGDPRQTSIYQASRFTTMIQIAKEEDGGARPSTVTRRQIR